MITPWTYSEFPGGYSLVNALGQHLLHTDREADSISLTAEEWRLIAAAPELLEACERLMHYLALYQAKHLDWEAVNADKERVLAAIKKAKEGNHGGR